MAITNINTLKTFFETGDKPTQGQFASLIDSFSHKHDQYKSQFYPLQFFWGEKAVKREHPEGTFKVNLLGVEFPFWEVIQDFKNRGGSVTLLMHRRKPYKRGTNNITNEFEIRPHRWTLETKPEVQERVNAIVVNEKRAYYDFTLDKYLSGYSWKRSPMSSEVHSFPIVRRINQKIFIGFKLRFDLNGISYVTPILGKIRVNSHTDVSGGYDGVIGYQLT